MKILHGALCILLLSALLPNSARGATGCSAEWAYTTTFRNHVVSIVTGTDTASASNRTAFNLPAVAATEVYFVTDSTTCAQAATAFGREVALANGTPGPGLWVLRVGPTRYIVFDHRQASGEFLDQYVFDASFNYLLTMTG